MYTIRMDDQVLYSPAMMGKEYRVLTPKLVLDVNANGSCTFVLPPGNRLYSDVRRRKGIVTVHQDGQEIFRGRVLDDEVDTYKQKSVSCEGVRGYLNDSQAAPYSYTGTPRGLLAKLIDEHNAQIEPEKQFTVGRVTVDRADEALECENVAYWETYKEIDEKLLSAYGGYLKARIENGILYLDWVKDYGSENAQEIRFAVNLLDIKDKQDTGEMFTILRPLGASNLGEDGSYSQPITIASVNNGLDYIQDDDAIARYGRIWKTQTWNYVEDPAELLTKAREFMRIGAELRTITLSAIDMHFLSGSSQAIHVGDTVHIVSPPHGIDLEKVCSKIEIDLCNPENTLYTFGEAPKALTDNIVKAEEALDDVTGFKGGGGGRGKVKEEMNGIIRWAELKVNAAEASIDMLTGEANSLKDRLSKAEVHIDGINAQIVLLASQEEVNELGTRLTQAEIEIDGANAQIVLKASKKEVDDLGERVSSAEIEIDGLNSEISLKADKITLNGYVTANQLQTEFTNFKSGISDSLYVSGLSAGSFECTSFSFKGSGMSLKSKSVVTGITRSKRNCMSSDGKGTVTFYACDSYSTSTLYYMSWE